MKTKLLCAILVVAFVTFTINTNTYAYNPRTVFSDFSPEHWAYNSVMELYSQQIISGDSDGNFRPNDFVTNAEAAKIFCTALGLNISSFDQSVYSDVSADKWYYPYANLTDELFLDVYDDMGKKIFSPDCPMIREEMFYSVVNMFGMSGKKVEPKLSQHFTDTADFNQVYLPYAEIIFDKKIINGYDDGTIRPKAKITRAEFATLTAKIMTMLKNRCSISVSEGEATIIQPWEDASGALKLVMKKRGPNSLFDFYCASAMTKYSEEYIPVRYFQFDTDLMSPYIVRALNNADGDLPYNADFTGGNHCYNNTGYGGSATGRTDYIKFSVDNSLVSEYSGLFQSVQVEYKNYIQATNTKRFDGSGREVLTENISIWFDGETWTVENTLTALEDIVIERYYGLQFPAKGIFNTVQYGDEHSDSYVHSLSFESVSDSSCDTAVFYGDIFNLKMNMDFSLMSEKVNFANKDYTVFTTDYGKTYFNLINSDNPIELKAGETLKIAGSYKFFK